jgi:hypothetical protein
MNMNAKLSVSSVILAAVLSGCSQQQVIGGSQVVNGSSQQVAGGSQVSNSSSQQVAGGSQVNGGSQQQVEKAAPVVIQAPVAKRAPIRVYRKAAPAKRVYKTTPKPTRSIRRTGLGLPTAKAGQCFAKIKINATYKTQSRRILVSKATSKRVLVRAPQHRFINKKVQVRKAYYKTRTVPAQYRTTNKHVLVKPAYNTWKKGHGAITRIDNMTGEIMCRVKVPAVYKNISQRVLIRPAQNIRTLVPAVYKTVKQKRFIAPALYKTIRTPARYKTQNYRVKTGGARYAWRAVLCKTNAPKNYRKAVIKRKPVVRTAPIKQYRQSSNISYQDYMRVMSAGSNKANLNKAKKVSKRTVLKKKAKVTTPKPKANTPKQTKSATKKSIVYGIQKALKVKGFDPGTMDGKMGPGTAAALKAFQSSRGLPIGQLSKDTFRALGLIR